MFVMGVLYAMAYVLGISYKAMNIYAYFVFYPASFSLFLKSKWKYAILGSSLLFFLVPNFEGLSVRFFDECVVFLNFMADKFHSDYIRMSIYLCVYVPLLFYVPFLYLRMTRKNFIKMIAIIGGLALIYALLVAPLIKPLLVSALNGL